MENIDYKNTLNLPVTSFPMKANLPDAEPKRIAQWNEIDLYAQLGKKNAGKPKFILNDGPPYANGNIHIGHAVNKVLKDIIVKSKLLSNMDAPFVPGWDCHGLPIELNVEKNIGKAGVKVTAKEFRAACREYASSQIALQKASFIRLGVIGEWERPYITMDYKFEADVMRSLGKVRSNGHILRGEKPVHWCIDCGSALAEAEVEYQDKVSPSIDVKFTIIDDSVFAKFGLDKMVNKDPLSCSIVIWTTTPWTIPANQAVAIHPDLEYSLVKVRNSDNRFEYLILASSLVSDCCARYGITEFKVEAAILGANLIPLSFNHPFCSRQVPLVLGEHVTLDAGTGAVHTAPSHGVDDFNLGKKYNLPIVTPVLANGCYADNAEYFAGKFIFKAQTDVIALLQERGALLQETKVNHSYPHCWRHKAPIIFRAASQWFISMDQNKLREHALAAIKHVNWIPDWGQARIESMVDGRPDWCISRQRAWGVPIPFVVHKETEAFHPELDKIIAFATALVEKNGVDAWYEFDLSQIINNADQYIKVTDVVDVWFDSGVVHECVLQQRSELAFPADLYLEGSDQHRGWFQSSLLSSVAINGVAPFKAVLTHGYAVDQQGRKMSKSLGNVVAPEKVISTMGADILRLWVSFAEYKSEITVSDEILKRSADAYRRIRNTARFLLANIHDFNPETDIVKEDELLALDRWIVEKAQMLQAEIIAAYNDYQFHNVAQKIQSFCILELGGFYLDIIKDRQYTLAKNSKARRSCQSALYIIAQAMVPWMAPILTFTAEEIYQYLPGKKEESIFFTTWYEKFPSFVKSEMDDIFWQEVIRVKQAVNKAIEASREQGIIGAGLAAEVIIYVKEDVYQVLSKLQDELRFVLITSQAKLEQEANATIDAVEIDGIKIKILPSEHVKCVRCWHHRSDVGEVIKHPELCVRCVENIAGKGEKRLYA